MVNLCYMILSSEVQEYSSYKALGATLTVLWKTKIPSKKIFLCGELFWTALHRKINCLKEASLILVEVCLVYYVLQLTITCLISSSIVQFRRNLERMGIMVSNYFGYLCQLYWYFQQELENVAESALFW